jgi:hypothetical protein
VTRIRFTVRGFDGVLDDLARIARTAGRARPLLEQVLARQFADAQAKVHVHTGATKASGRTSSDYDSVGQRWVGTLEWGPTEGIHWELERGGEHSAAWDQLYLWHDEYEDAIRQAFEGGD